MCVDGSFRVVPYVRPETCKTDYFKDSVTYNKRITVLPEEKSRGSTNGTTVRINEIGLDLVLF